jgi:hypothetical protein
MMARIKRTSSCHFSAMNLNADQTQLSDTVQLLYVSIVPTVQSKETSAANASMPYVTPRNDGNGYEELARGAHNLDHTIGQFQSFDVSSQLIGDFVCFIQRSKEARQFHSFLILRIDRAARDVKVKPH